MSPSPRPAAGNGTAGADVIKTQINLPWSKAIDIALNSLKIRIWRSMITGAGIFLSIAFLCYSALPLLLHETGGAELNRQKWLVTMALMVCLVGIMNSMLMSVAERFQEIGTMKCLGALNSLIVRLFLIEAVFMGIIASFGGWLLGFVARLLMRGGTHGMTPGSILELFALCIGTGALLTLIAALLPALRAAQMPPAAALRTEV